jgi:hypothetical protein
MDRFSLAIAGGVVALVAAGLVAAAVLRNQPPDVNTPSGVVLAYASAEERGDGQTAWNLLAASTQSRADRDRFIAGVNRTNSSEYVSTESEQIDRDGASVVLVRTYPGSGSIFGGSSYSTRSTVRLNREEAGWRITVPPDAYNLVSPPKS